jgi:hypothetical protein
MAGDGESTLGQQRRSDGDETGIANVVVKLDLYERNRPVVTCSGFILPEDPAESGRRDPLKPLRMLQATISGKRKKAWVYRHFVRLGTEWQTNRSRA